MRTFTAAYIASYDGSDLPFDTTRLENQFRWFSHVQGDWIEHLKHPVLAIEIAPSQLNFYAGNKARQEEWAVNLEALWGWKNLIDMAKGPYEKMGPIDRKGFLQASFITSGDIALQLKAKTAAFKIAELIEKQTGIVVGNGPNDKGSVVMYEELIRLMMPLSLANQGKTLEHQG